MTTVLLRNGRTRGHALTTVAAAAAAATTRVAVRPNNPLAVLNVSFFDSDHSCRRRHLSNNSGRGGRDDDAKKSSSSFRPRRRSSPNYRPVPSGTKKRIDLSPGNDHKFVTLGKNNNNNNNNFMVNKTPRTNNDELEAALGPLAADVVKDLQKEIESSDSFLDDTVEEYLRLADYMVAEDGSTEDLVGERRTLAGAFDDLKERDEFMQNIDELIRAQRIEDLDLEDKYDGGRGMKKNKKRDEKQQNSALEGLFGMDDDDNMSSDDQDPSLTLDRNQLAHGEWSEMLVGVGRTIKLWRGGRLESYRALVIGGNLNGCGGFGIGKAKDPLVAVDVAGRHCKRNIFFVDRYQGSSLTRDLVGKQNSCIVRLRATDNGLRGNELCREILKRFGITNCVAKSHGNRNPYNVVRATFKALMTHESLEDIALKRGKRIVSIDRAMRMQV